MLLSMSSLFILAIVIDPCGICQTRRNTCNRNTWLNHVLSSYSVLANTYMRSGANTSVLRICIAPVSCIHICVYVQCVCINAYMYIYIYIYVYIHMLVWYDMS